MKKYTVSYDGSDQSVEGWDIYDAAEKFAKDYDDEGDYPILKSRTGALVVITDEFGTAKQVIVSGYHDTYYDAVDAK